MRILMTGGTGLIGRHLCKALLAEGHELTVFSRNPASVPVKCGAGVQALTSLAEWSPAREFDAVINLAGEPIVDRRWTKQRKQVLWASRVALTEELVQRIVAAEHRPSVLLSGSAVGYYGNRGNVLLDETAAPGDDFPAQLCKAWEQAARVAENAGVRVCLLRTGLVLGNDGGLLGRMLPPFRLGLGGRIGDGRQWMSWIHIGDYVAIVLRLLSDGQIRGPCNLTAPRPVTNAEFTRTLAAVLHRPAFLAIPAALLKPGLGEAASLLLGGQRVVPGKLQDAQYGFRFGDLRGALSDLLA